MEKSPYDILKISPKSTFDEIREAYLFHVRSSPPEKDPEGFKKIRQAYEILKDSESRKKLDLSSFLKEPDFKMEHKKEINFNELFKYRLFTLILPHSDLYINNLDTYFENIDERIKKL